MGKIVKYCSACEESFAEKFSFCPNCAAELSAFEMKPVDEKIASDPTPEPETPKILAVDNAASKAPEAESDPVLEVPELETVSFEAEPIPAETVASEEPIHFEAEPISAETVASEEPIHFEARTESVDLEQSTNWKDEFVPENSEVRAEGTDESAETEVAAGTFLGLLEVERKKRSDAGQTPMTPQQEARLMAQYDYEKGFGDENYHVTVISERASKTRNGLLLGAFSLIVVGFFSLLTYSLFSNLGEVGSLVDDDRLFAMLDVDPLTIEEEQQKKDDDEGGGGGGGGKNEDKPVSKGELVTQTRPPMMPPSPTIPRLPDPSLPVVTSTEGDNKRNRIEAPGLPDALSSDPSSGPGSGGGMGRGTGTGMGDGFGTGEGTGTGSGSGGGNGDGNGNGNGPGSGRASSPPRSGPTTDIKILSKPRPGYTDEARQQNVRGTVILRVTFLANGSIGSVSTVKGLPYGLTEKAIVAARQIRFTPPMRNGQPYTVNKVVHFNFTIY